MPTRTKIFLSLVLFVVVAAITSLHASDPGYQTGMNPTRELSMKIDRTNGTPMNGLYIAQKAFAGDTALTVTLTGASAATKLFTSKGTGSTASYVKSAVMSVNGNAALVTMSAATTGTIQVMAVDVFTDPLTF